jgi:hypothetical protein
MNRSVVHVYDGAGFFFLRRLTATVRGLLACRINRYGRYSHAEKMFRCGKSPVRAKQ